MPSRQMTQQSGVLGSSPSEALLVPWWWEEISARVVWRTWVRTSSDLSGDAAMDF